MKVLFTVLCCFLLAGQLAGAAMTEPVPANYLREIKVNVPETTPAMVNPNVAVIIDGNVLKIKANPTSNHLIVLDEGVFEAHYKTLLSYD